MPYSAEISRANPTCLVVLLDQSGSMGDPFGGGEAQLRKADFLADVANRTLHDLVIRCTKAEEIRDYYYVSIIGYGVTGGAVTSAFEGQLAGRTLVKISDVGEYPARLDDRKKKVPDGAGGLVEQAVKFPIWINPKAENGTPMCAALLKARGVLESWLSEHPHCFPPVVLHITDGESQDGDPTAAGQSIMDLKSSDGSVVLLNCHLSSQRAPKIEYPSDAVSLPDPFAKTLFGMSSIMPAEFRAAGAAIGVSLGEGARGFVFNADAAALVQFFDIGTRPGNLR
jgi:hypothetical protein